MTDKKIRFVDRKEYELRILGRIEGALRSLKMEEEADYIAGLEPQDNNITTDTLMVGNIKDLLEDK